MFKTLYLLHQIIIVRHEILDAMEDREIILVEHRRKLISSLITKKALLESQIGTLLKTYGVDANEISEYRDLIYQHERVSGLIMYLQNLTP